jgi:hypothetical protein
MPWASDLAVLRVAVLVPEAVPAQIGRAAAARATAATLIEQAGNAARLEMVVSAERDQGYRRNGPPQVTKREPVRRTHRC